MQKIQKKFCKTKNCQNAKRKFSSATTPPHHQVKFFEKSKIKIFKNNA